MNRLEDALAGKCWKQLFEEDVTLDWFCLDVYRSDLDKLSSTEVFLPKFQKKRGRPRMNWKKT